jgi:hypothetical protein
MFYTARPYPCCDIWSTKKLRRVRCFWYAIVETVCFWTWHWCVQQNAWNKINTYWRSTRLNLNRKFASLSSVSKNHWHKSLVRIYFATDRQSVSQSVLALSPSGTYDQILAVVKTFAVLLLSWGTLPGRRTGLYCNRSLSVLEIFTNVQSVLIFSYYSFFLSSPSSSYSACQGFV